MNSTGYLDKLDQDICEGDTLLAPDNTQYDVGWHVDGESFVLISKDGWMPMDNYVKNYLRLNQEL